ncbi:reverse transcriptase domain-containing protein [Tanacetum coccineum]
MVKEGIVLGHKVSRSGLEIDKAKIDVISKLPPPTNIKGIRSFLRHVSFYRRFIKDFSKIARPLTKLLEKDTPFEFDDECLKAFESLKEKLTCASVIVSPNWNLLFELMCDASDFAVGAVLEFDIEIKDKKGTENVAADHLSRIDNDETSDESDIDDNFPKVKLLEITTKNEPWFADFTNYLVGDIIPKGMTYQQKNKFFSDLKSYFWEEPYLFRMCFDGMIRRCVYGPETRTILYQCHHRPIGGHYGPNITANKVLDSGFYWPTIIKEAHTLVCLCEACQRIGNIYKLDEMLLTNIQVCEIFIVWGIDFMGPFLKSYKFEYIFVAVDYVSKWAEVQALPTNDARVVIIFLKKLFCHFGMPKALISDREHHAYWALKNCNPDLIAAGEKRMFQLHELDELRHQAYENSRLCKARTKVWHDRILRVHLKTLRAQKKINPYKIHFGRMNSRKDEVPSWKSVPHLALKCTAFQSKSKNKCQVKVLY